MKWIVFFFFIGFCSANAQNKSLLYGFTDIPQSILVNPGAEVKNNHYIGVPLLSSIYAQVGTTGITAYDLFNTQNNNFNEKLRGAIYSMDNRDFFTVNQQIDIFSGGFTVGRSPFEKNGYISFGMYQETDLIAYFPKDYAILAYEGNANHIGKPFRLSDLNLKGEVLSVFHVGYTHKVNKKLSLGVRGKVYSGVFDVTSTKNQGSFTTTVESDNNYYKHTFDLNLQAQTSGLRSFLDENPNTSTSESEIRNRLLFGGNLGFGIDLGFTYNIQPNWEVSGSILDIGFISHTKEVQNYSIDGYYEFEGLNVLFPQQANATTQDNWDEIKDAYEDLFEVQESTSSYITWRPLKLYGALAYKFNNRSNSCDCNISSHKYTHDYNDHVGLQLFAINRPKNPLLSATAFYYKQIAKQVKMKLTYTADSYSFTNIGLGTSLHFGRFNTYFLVDNLIELQDISKANNISFQVGFNYIVR